MKTMANILLTCLAPSTSSVTDRLAGELISGLVVDLNRLEKSLEENPPTLRWCTEAMVLVKKIHSCFLVYFERIKDKETKDSEPWEEGVSMVDEYMGVSLDVLDLCNLIKSAISGLNRQRMMVDFMVKTVKEGSSSFTTMESRIELERNEYKFGEWREMKLNNGNNSKVKMRRRRRRRRSRTDMNVLQTISNTMSVISSFVFFSILHPIPSKFREKLYSRFGNRDLFSESVGKKAIITFSKERSVLHEKEMIENALVKFTAEFMKTGEDEGKLTEHLDELKNRSAELKQGIELLESVINELFEDVINERKKMIDSINTSNHSIYTE